MNSENEVRRLEGFVAKLLKSFQELKEEKARLVADLQDRDETIAGLQAKLDVTDNERNELSSRVSNIIEQIEEWEINLGEEVFDDEVSNDGSSEQGNLFPSSNNAMEEDSEEERVVNAGYGE